MANTYLTVPFKDKDAAKALGARWDGVQRQWFVPEGRELAPFSSWLPDRGVRSTVQVALELSPPLDRGLVVGTPRKGISLSSLLAGVSQAVAQAYRSGVWTLVEVVELRVNSGHVFLGVSERDAQGTILAKTSAVIWQSTANAILPEFERATGAQLAAGIKLLVRARPVFKPQHGFSIEIDAIDSEYTLGDLEAKKREIRERLQVEGVFSANKQLPRPWDFNSVLVVAPAGGAGLGDFQAEANRLEKFGICQFTYVFSRFQGEGAAKEIGDALQVALQNLETNGTNHPDAIVIIRGGGAVNDMAWLNDYDLARLICDTPIPVLTGIGHERDSTVLDEVANLKFDTPSKVIAGIEQVIVKRTAQAKTNFEQVIHQSSREVQSVKANAASLDATIRSGAQGHLASGRQAVQSLISGISLDSIGQVRAASERSEQAIQVVKTGARAQIAQSRQDLPMYWGVISLGTKYALHSASAALDASMGDVMGQSRRDIATARIDSDVGMETIANSARGQVRDGGIRSEALMREIAGQGPDKTLKRGFVLVRNHSGKSITRAAQGANAGEIEIQFSDGRLAAIAGQQKP